MSHYVDVHGRVVEGLVVERVGTVAARDAIGSPGLDLAEQVAVLDQHVALAVRDDVGAPDALRARALPVVRDLLARGLLLPPATAAGDPA